MSKQIVPAPFVVLAALVVFFGAWIAGSTGDADAHPNVWYDFSWPGSTVDVSIGDLDAPIRDIRSRNSMLYGMEPWNALPGSAPTFIGTGVVDETVHWGAGDNACTVAPSNGIWIVTRNHSNGVIAKTARCGNSSTGVQSEAVISFDDIGTPWYTGHSIFTTPGDRDMRGVAVHEFGHALGFSGHFSGTTTTSCGGALRQTLCSQSSIGQSWWRTLEVHDLHTHQGEYGP